MGDKLRSHHGRKCFWCQRIMQSGSRFLKPTRDHVIPKSRGGTKTVICCLSCNNLKGDMPPAIWALMLERFPAIHDELSRAGPRGMGLFYALMGQTHDPNIDRIVAEAMARFPEYGEVKL